MSNTVIVSVALMGILIFVLGANVTRHRAMRGVARGTTAVNAALQAVESAET